jgi:transposase
MGNHQTHVAQQGSRRCGDAAVQMTDTSIVRVHQHGACVSRNKGQSMARSRGGLTSKIHAVVDSNGLPVRLALTAGEAHDNRLAAKLLSRLKSGAMLLADRGYDADWIRALVSEHGAWANIPPRRNRRDALCFSPYLYRARNLVERFFNKIKQCRRWRRATTSLRRATLRSSNLRRYAYGCVLMSPRPWPRVPSPLYMRAAFQRCMHANLTDYTKPAISGLLKNK